MDARRAFAAARAFHGGGGGGALPGNRWSSRCGSRTPDMSSVVVGPDRAAAQRSSKYRFCEAMATVGPASPSSRACGMVPRGTSWYLVVPLGTSWSYPSYSPPPATCSTDLCVGPRSLRRLHIAPARRERGEHIFTRCVSPCFRHLNRSLCSSNAGQLQ